MDKFFNTCRRCLNPWVVGIIIAVVIGLIIFIPIVGITALIAVLPLVGCAFMCGAMAFSVGKKK